MDQPFSLFRILTALAVGCVVIGCGSSATSPDTSSDSGALAVPTESTSKESHSPLGDGQSPSSTSGTTRAQDEVWEDADGNRFIGRVPYDVFFDQPLAVAANGQFIPREIADTKGAPAESPGAQQPAATHDSGTAVESSATDSWASVLPAGVLDTEIKAARNFLNQKLQSVGSYNSSVAIIPMRAATVAVLAGIAIEHSEDISWKDDAGFIRDLAARMNEATLQRGANDQRRLLALFEDLTDTLSRSRPSGLEEPDPETSLAEVAEMRLVMMRIEESEQLLRTEISESSFAAKQQQVQHEASLLAGLMSAMTTEGYGFADDPEFLGHATGVIEAAQAIRDATQSGSYEDFERQLSRISTTCQDCHRAYKNN